MPQDITSRCNRLNRVVNAPGNAQYQKELKLQSLRGSAVPALISRSMLEDQIALYGVFEDILRQELFNFVETCNLHKIRLQKSRFTFLLSTASPG